MTRIVELVRLCLSRLERVVERRPEGIGRRILGGDEPEPQHPVAPAGTVMR